MKGLCKFLLVKLILFKTFVLTLDLTLVIIYYGYLKKYFLILLNNKLNHVLSTGVRVIFDNDQAVDVVVPDSYMGDMLGMCGNFDGQEDNDFQVEGQVKLVFVFVEFM